MTTFKQFLAEGRGKSASASAFIKWVEANCAKYLKNEHWVYRGFHNSEPGLLIGNSGGDKPRKSVGGIPNNYTLWIDGHPKFKAFPKRSRSWIASTNSTKAGDFGPVYLMVCKDNDKVASALAGDIWVTKVFGNMELMVLNSITEEILWRFGLGNNDTYFQFQNALQHVTKKKIQAFVDSSALHNLKVDCRNIINIMDENGWKDLYDVWDKGVTPNMFSMTTGAAVNEVPPGEVWIEGEAGFIPMKSGDISAEDEKEIGDWLKEVNPFMHAILTHEWNRTRQKPPQPMEDDDVPF